MKRQPIPTVEESKPLDVTGVPRYAASFPLQTTFITNANKTGDHLFAQVLRQGRYAIYKRTVVATGKHFKYEVIKISIVKAGTVYATGSTPTQSDSESYPGEASWGKSGWEFNTLAAANVKFQFLLNQEQANASTPTPSTPVIPTNNFTLTEFAEANNTGSLTEAATLVTNLLKTRNVRYVGKNEKNMQVFVKE